MLSSSKFYAIVMSKCSRIRSALTARIASASRPAHAFSIFSRSHITCVNLVSSHLSPAFAAPPRSPRALRGRSPGRTQASCPGTGRTTDRRRANSSVSAAPRAPRELLNHDGGGEGGGSSCSGSTLPARRHRQPHALSGKRSPTPRPRRAGPPGRLSRAHGRAGRGNSVSRKNVTGTPSTRLLKLVERPGKNVALSRRSSALVRVEPVG